MNTSMVIPKNDKKTIFGWVLFDWANSSYALVISVAIFPIYFANITEDTIQLFGADLSNSSVFSFAVTAAYLILLLLSPLLSGIADISGRKKFFLRGFTTMGALGCMAMFFFHDAYPDAWIIGSICFIIATMGFAGGLVFYNAYLPLIATEDRYDKISARGFAYGYVGSVLLMLICLVLIMKPEWFGIQSSTLPSRIAFVMVGLWWLGFAQVSFHRLPKDAASKWTKEMLSKGHREIVAIWHIVKTKKHMLRFLAAFFFYSSGVQTVLFLASTFAEQELNFAASELIMTILILQLVAIGGAYLFAQLSTRYGNKISILTMLLIWIALCIAAYFVTSKTHFFIIAGAVGLAMGGIQSQSRSAYAKLIPENTVDTTSFFSFYDVLEKAAIVFGTFAFGMIDVLTGGMRNSVLTLALFFFIGILFTLTVRFGDREKIA